MTQTQPQPGQIWRCWNGDLYVIDCVTQQSEHTYFECLHKSGFPVSVAQHAKHTESEKGFIYWEHDGKWWHEPQHGAEPHTVYASLDGSKIWARPLPMFLSDRNGQPRFVYTGDHD